MWPQHKVEIYERMVAQLRHALGRPDAGIAPQAAAALEQIITEALASIDLAPPIVARGLDDPDDSIDRGAPATGGPAVHEPGNGESLVHEPRDLATAGDLPEALDPAPVPSADAAAPATDPFSHGAHAVANRQLKARTLARWLWDRNISPAQVLGYSNKWRNKIARAAGVNPPSTLETWTVAAELMGAMEQLKASGTQPVASERHHLDEHEQWATEP